MRVTHMALASPAFQLISSGGRRKLKPMSRFALTLGFCITWCGAIAAQSGDVLQRGTVIPRVVCAGNLRETYALYLPSSYSPAKRWPIIYAFDPGARGQVAVEAIRAAAEKYGYIVAGSNNSRNGAEAISTEAANSMWHDTHQRFSIDEHRRYFAGMSGGARMATALAISCTGCVAGVVANAAGFPQGQKPSSALKFAYFAALGNADFNFLEFVDLRRELEESGIQYRIRVFQGWHGWAPPEVWQEALNWMDIQAMRSGLLARDPARIQESYEDVMNRANRFRSDKDVLAAFRESKFAAQEFSGLTDTHLAEKLTAEFANDKHVKSGEKRELSAAADQRGLMEEPSLQMDALANGKLGAGDLMTLRDTFSLLLKQVEGSPDASDATTLIRRRALSGLVIQALESGQFAMDRKQYDVALRLFDLAVAGSENPGWGHYQRARVYAVTADKKHMLAELKQAFAGRYHESSALSSQEFQPFQSDPEFQAITRQWSAKNQP